ncbi:MAG: hypothetical protein KC416_17900, partial [Myxococcales bacterium]|nr:hypothetical protein [Myxococcales bacterium]
IPFHGSATMVWSIDTGRRVLSTLGHYVALTAWPFEPSVQRALRHALPGGTPFFDPWSIWLGAGTLAVLLLLALGALRYRALRSPVADLTWFFLPLAPVLQVVDLQTYALVSERFIYFPLLGLAALLTRVLPKATVPSIVGGAIVLGACAWTTATHTHHFKSEETLWRHELALRPQNHAALKTLAQIEWNRGNHETALDLDRRGFEAA